MKKYKSEAFEAIHEFMGDLYKVGGISDERMRHFDEACLVKPAVPHTTAQEPAFSARSGMPMYARGK
ncbi:MAG: XRE family transcriptional regulator [Spirochaetaceae bacterium]|jgi:putative transcriptional regulator|nr:XRE family transcriptional regulator [Spirochaetaceae bacterium]